MSIKEKLVIELMNLKDTVKYELSELNEQQYLFMNGPAPQLMKRAMKMSYILGQKKRLITFYYSSTLAMRMSY